MMKKIIALLALFCFISVNFATITMNDIKDMDFHTAKWLAKLMEVARTAYDKNDYEDSKAHINVGS